MVNKNGQFLPGLDDLADVSRQTIKAIIAAGSDIALLVTAEGIVQDVYVAPETPPANDIQAWSGHGLADIVTEESRVKVADMLARARSDETPRWREINHVGAGAEDFPVRYAAVRAGSGGEVILLGRDLRMVAQLQKRLVQAQLTMEQDYERIRQIETRYRVLFETTHEALLIVSAETGRVIDANSAAARLFGREVRELTDRVFGNRFEPESQEKLAAVLAEVRDSGRERAVTLRVRGESRPVNLDVLLFRSVNETLFLCRLTPVEGDGPIETGFENTLEALYRQTADAIVFTDLDGGILWTNTAFLALADVAVGESLRGTSLGTFLGRPGMDLALMMSNARQNGRLAAYATSLRSAFGIAIPVEISTAYLPDANPEGFGFVLRDVSRTAPARGTGPTVSSDAVENIIELVGSTPLRELVRGTTDVVEKLCIETAIKLTNNNRASAAEMLGLSRQSLYVKLRKYGLIDQDTGEED
jgi:transcriptional regulator PpsR